MDTEEKKPEVEVAQTAEVTASAEPTAQEEDTPEKINWRKFREAREKERKEKVAAEKRAYEKEQEVAALKAAMEAIVNRPSAQYQESSEQDETDDQRIKRLVSETIQEQRRKEEQEYQQREQQEFPVRLKRDFNDFDTVCSTENLDYLEYHYPEVADAFKELPDNYSKWAKVYKAVKKFVPNTDGRKEKGAAEKNLNRPQAMSAAGKTTTGDTAPQYLDDKRKADNWQRMQRAMRGGA